MIKCSSLRSTSPSQRRIKTRSLTLQTHQRRRHTRSNKHTLSTCTGMREQPAMHPTANALASMARLVTTSAPRSTVTTLLDAQSNQRKSGLVSPVPRVPLSSVNVIEPRNPNEPNQLDSISKFKYRQGNELLQECETQDFYLK